MKYGVIYSETIYHEGDGSRTHPGHGYPAYTEEKQVIRTFESETEFLAWVQRNDSPYSSVRSYKSIRFEELTIERKVSFNVK